MAERRCPGCGIPVGDNQTMCWDCWDEFTETGELENFEGDFDDPEDEELP